MAGIKPGFCGNYRTLELPIYSVKESKSNGIQFLRKLYFQSYRDVYTHSECNYKCVFGCRQVGYDEEIMSELLIRDTPDLYVYQCDSVHAWVFIVAVVITFTTAMILVTCYVRNKISSIRGITKEENV